MLPFSETEEKHLPGLGLPRPSLPPVQFSGVQSTSCAWSATLPSPGALLPSTSMLPPIQHIH